MHRKRSPLTWELSSTRPKPAKHPKSYIEAKNVSTSAVKEAGLSVGPGLVPEVSVDGANFLLGKVRGSYSKKIYLVSAEGKEEMEALA